MAFGLDSVLGASFLVYILVQTLSQFEFTPILGDWKAARARIGFLAIQEMMRFWEAMGMTD